LGGRSPRYTRLGPVAGEVNSKIQEAAKGHFGPGAGGKMAACISCAVSPFRGLALVLGIPENTRWMLPVSADGDVANPVLASFK
jgi:hypothetical protein